MTDQSNKSPYSSPRVVEFGSVRNLTGGSMSIGTDGMGLMTAMMILM